MAPFVMYGRDMSRPQVGAEHARFPGSFDPSTLRPAVEKVTVIRRGRPEDNTSCKDFAGLRN